MKKVLGCIRRADERYSMIQEGDRVCVGVSGGKDSLLLLRGLGLYRRFARVNFEVMGIMLDLGLKQQDTEAIRRYAEGIEVPFEVLHTDIGQVVFSDRKEKNPCALCATLRRGALNNAARERGCNKVALGHNREDVLETFLMSLFYEGRINTFDPVTRLERAGVTMIRPMIFLPEKYALGLSRHMELPVLPANCTVAGHTKREEAKQLLYQLASVVPDIEEKMLHAIIHTENYGLWDKMTLPAGFRHMETEFGGRVVPSHLKDEEIAPLSSKKF